MERQTFLPFPHFCSSEFLIRLSCFSYRYLNQIRSSSICQTEQRFNDSIEHSKNISEFTHGFLQKLIEESRELQSHAIQVDEIQTTSILEFQKAYEVHFAEFCAQRKC